MSYIVTRDNVRLFCKDWGRGRPVVMLHGWPLSSDTFDDLGMALADAGMRAVAYDRRGFGRSDQPWTGYDFDTLSDDLDDVLAHVNSSEVTLLGFSMGGGEVARYMSRHTGAHVAQAVLVSSVVPYLLQDHTNPDGVAAAVFDEIAQGIRGDRADFWEGFFRTFYGISLVSHPVSDAVVAWSCRLAMQASLKATLACAEAFATTDFRPDLAAFRVPTLLIHGTADQIVPIDLSSRTAATGIAGSTFIEYEDGPHGLLASHKERLIQDVLEFVRVRG
jgi:non-heme chloroperoxidase